MNAVCHTWVQGVEGACIDHMSEIQDPSPHYRLVFIDEGSMTSDAFAVYYTDERWFDDPPVRHGEGVTVSFADGHSEWHKWQGRWTVFAGLASIIGHSGSYAPGDTIDGETVPASSADYQDLYWMQKGCWGGFDYVPTY